MIIVGCALLLTGSLLLIWSGLAHARRFGAFHAIVVSQRIVGYRAVRPVALAAVVAELLIGSVGLAVTLGAAWLPGPVLRAVAATVAAFYLLLAGYVGLVMRRTPGAPCGCFGDDEPVSVPTLVRPIVLAATALAVVVLPSVPVGLVEVALAAAAAVPLAVLGRYLPALVGVTGPARR